MVERGDRHDVARRWASRIAGGGESPSSPRNARPSVSVLSTMSDFYGAFKESVKYEWKRMGQRSRGMRPR